MRKVHFLGIGGIGMSGLARWACYNQFIVSGYDREKSEITNDLEKLGISITFNKNYIKKICLKDFADTIVYSSAFKNNHPILNFFNQNKCKTIKRSDFLAEIASSYDVIAIAGTHGKTTISCMLSHILKNSGINCNAFLGGISKNYNSNILIGDSNIMIIEADEYDRSFLSLKPKIGLVTSMDKDHTDTYYTYYEMLDAYNLFIQKCKKTFINIDLINSVNQIRNCVWYSFNNANNYSAYTYVVQSGNGNKINLKIKKDDEFLINTDVANIPKHNIENLLVSMSIAIELQVEPEKIMESIKSFNGVQRRFEYHINKNNLILIEDYAHHPKELNVLINSVYSLYPEKKITCVFQPHLFSRTKEFLNDFATALSQVNRLILLDIYPAREEPIKNFGIDDLFIRIKLDKKIVLNKKDVCEYLLKTNCELIIVVGAGDIHEIIPELKKRLI